MITRDAISELDRLDPLALQRDAFALPRDKIYLDGNSLGALPRAAVARVQDTLQQEWGADLISSWNRHGWIDLPLQVGEKIAPLVGAAPGQVICADSISVNLFKLLSVVSLLRPERPVILSAADNFPTDLYMVQGLSRLLGEQRLRLVQVAEEEIVDALSDQVAAVLLSHVNFRSGRILPMADISSAAHAAGVLAIWDLAHSAGAMPVALDQCEVDFAVGCGYKFFNGGPGAPAWVYAARRHQDAIQQPLSGWMGHRAPFAFDPEYEAAPGMLQYLCGTPPILSMAALDAALDLFAEVDMEALRAKSVALGTLFLELLQKTELAAELRLLSPSASEQRGSQLAFSHPQAYGLVQAWIERGVVADFREPDVLRVGFAPLYNSYGDIWQALEALREVVAGREHLDPRWSERQKVT
ncbi:MAG: kynureninase [Halieaceae bacterium]|jgi:kynureninase|nr:kynureninase [Halieaceae bacterium]